MSFVKLNDADRETLIEIVQQVMDYKCRALKPQNWQTWEREYLPRLVEQISLNQWRCFRSDDNTFTWLADQIRHSRLLQDGVPLKEGIPLDQTTLGARAVDICRRASQGQRVYNASLATDQFRHLFK